MDLVSLIAKAPGLAHQLRELDLDSGTIIRIGGELNRQLRSRSDRDLTDLLQRLDMQGFLAMVDVDQLSSVTGVGQALAEATLLLFGEAVQGFQTKPGTITAGSVTDTSNR